LLFVFEGMAVALFFQWAERGFAFFAGPPAWGLGLPRGWASGWLVLVLFLHEI
jgi:hypothetical protein